MHAVMMMPLLFASHCNIRERRAITGGKEGARIARIVSDLLTVLFFKRITDGSSSSSMMFEARMPSYTTVRGNTDQPRPDRSRIIFCSRRFDLGPSCRSPMFHDDTSFNREGDITAWYFLSHIDRESRIDSRPPLVYTIIVTLLSC